MVAFYRSAAITIQVKGDHTPDFPLSTLHSGKNVGNSVTDFLDYRYVIGLRIVSQLSGIAFLAAHLCEEYGLVGDDQHLIALGVYLKNLRLAAVLIKADELSNSVRA